MIEESVLERTLHRALAERRRLRRGVRRGPALVERHRSTTARSRSCAPVASGAPASGSCGARPPATRTPPTSPRTACARPPRPRPQPRAPADRARTSSRSTRRPNTPPHEVAVLPEGVEKARKVDLLDARRRRGPGRGRRDPPGHASATPTAGAGSSSRTPTVCSPRTTRCARASSCKCVAGRRHRDADRHGGARVHRRLRALRRAPARGDRPDRGGARAVEARRPGPRRAGSCRSCSKRGAGGVLFHEACGHGLEADLVGRGRVGVPGPGRRAGRVAARHPRRRRHASPASGARTRSTTRARPRSATC